MKPNIFIIMPAHNEEQRIGKTLEEYGKFFENLKKDSEIKDFEILVVLNGCKDNTIEIVKKEIRNYKEIRYIEFKQVGKGFALIEGFKEALKKDFDLIGFADADMSTSPEAFYDLVKSIKGHDGIIASRWLKGSIIKTKQTILRKITSRGFNFLVRSLFSLPYRDSQCLPGLSEVLVTIDGVPFKGSFIELEKNLSLKTKKRGKKFLLYDFKNDIKISSLNKKTKRIEHVPITGFVLRCDKKKLIKIKLEGGRTFFVSENHPLLMFKNNNFYKKPANRLKRGELLPIVKEWNFNTGVDYLDLIEYVKKDRSNNIRIHGWKNVLSMRPSQISKKINLPFHKVYLWYLRDRMPIKYYLFLEKDSSKRNKLSLCFEGGKHVIPAKIKIDNRLMRLIGYYISEGCCSLFDSKNKSRHTLRISFNKKEIDLIKETKKLFLNLFKIRVKPKYQKGCVIIGVYSRILCYLFKNILNCGADAFNKRVPAFIYGLNKEKIGNFIDAYFLGDGNIALHKQANSITIRANSASEGLIKDLQLLLLRIGITSGIHQTKRKNIIMGRKIKKFLKTRWNISVHAGSNIKRIQKYCPKIRKDYSRLFSKFKNKLPSFHERSSMEIKNSDLCLAMIRDIKKIDYDGKWYDFKIQSDEKPYENFMHDCGILSHNCGAKLFKREAVNSVVGELGITKWAFDVDLLYRIKRKGFKIKEIPTIWEDKKESKLSLVKVPFQMFSSIIRLRLLYSPFKFIVRLYNKIPEKIKIHH